MAAIAMRQAYGEALAELGRRDPRIVVLDADTSSSTRSAVFAGAFPDRFFNVGIAEANMAAMAAGLAATGKIPFINTFACFMVLRCGDPIRSLIAYSSLNVKIAGNYAGISDSYDGASHHAILDVAFMRALPNMTVLCPCDAAEAARATEAAAAHDGPVYLRLLRNPVPDLTADPREPFHIGRGRILREGHDVTLVAAGSMVARALAAAESLAARGVSARVVNMATIKPLDAELILRCAEQTRGIVTAEEHSVLGGLGGAVAELLGENRPTPMAFVGLQDTFVESGDQEKLMEAYGLTADRIAGKAMAVLEGKGGRG